MELFALWFTIMWMNLSLTVTGAIMEIKRNPVIGCLQWIAVIVLLCCWQHDTAMFAVSCLGGFLFYPVIYKDYKYWMLPMPAVHMIGSVFVFIRL
jgi:hypothetical protein